MTREEPTLGDLELEVLKVVWEEQPCQVSRVAEVMSDRGGYARTTVLTVMQRLTEKGFTKRRKRQGIYHYSMKKNREYVLTGLIDRFVDTVLDGSPSPIVAYLVDSGNLTPKQADTLRAIVRDLETQERGQ